TLSGDEVLDSESDRHESCLEFYSHLDGEPSKIGFENAGKPEEVSDEFYGDIVRVPLGRDPDNRSLQFIEHTDGNWYFPLPEFEGDDLRLIAPGSALIDN